MAYIPNITGNQKSQYGIISQNKEDVDSKRDDDSITNVDEHPTES